MSGCSECRVGRQARGGPVLQAERGRCLSLSTGVSSCASVGGGSAEQRGRVGEVGMLGGGQGVVKTVVENSDSGAAGCRLRLINVRAPSSSCGRSCGAEDEKPRGDRPVGARADHEERLMGRTRTQPAGREAEPRACNEAEENSSLPSGLHSPLSNVITPAAAPDFRFRTCK